MRIGFIGLGNMGSGMAANLLAAGHEVMAYNRSPEKAAALVERGATAVTTVADACTGDVVISMLADDPAVESVVQHRHRDIGRIRVDGGNGLGPRSVH